MKTVALPIEEWLRLSEEGREIPVEITLAGTSMQPLIRMNRDKITIRPLKEEPQVGDIVLFRRADGAFVVHRVYRIGKDSITTLGDNCERPDVAISRAQLLGKVVEIRRGNRTILPGSKEERRFSRIWTRILPVRRVFLHLKYVFNKYLGRVKNGSV